jgi:hypothetical protein
MAAMPRDVYRNFVRKLKQNMDIISNEIIGSHVTGCDDCKDFDVSDKYFMSDSKVLTKQ